MLLRQHLGILKYNYDLANENLGETTTSRTFRICSKQINDSSNRMKFAMGQEGELVK